MGKSTISMAIFNSYFDVYQRVMSFIHKLGSLTLPGWSLQWFNHRWLGFTRKSSWLVLNRCAEWRNITAWWFGSHDWIIFHFIYGMSSFPLTNISIYFSEGLVNHQPDQQTQTSNKDNLKVVRLPQDPDGSSDSQCHLDQDVYLYGAGVQTLCLRLWTIASASGSRPGVDGEFRSCGGELKDWTGQAATPCKKRSKRWGGEDFWCPKNVAILDMAQVFEP